MAREATLTFKKLVSLEPAMVDAIRNFRFAQRIETESEAIRRLIELGLSGQPNKENAGKPASAVVSLPEALSKMMMDEGYDGGETTIDQIPKLVADRIAATMSATHYDPRGDYEPAFDDFIKILGGIDYLRKVLEWQTVNRDKKKPSPAPALPAASSS